MKTYLAQRSFTETRIFGHRFTLEHLIGCFLRTLLADLPPARSIVIGRPVRFAGELADDDLGAARLRGAYAEAGLPAVTLALEPQAAGLRFARTLTQPATVLIGDFGGGTSDFSVMRFRAGWTRHAARPRRHRRRRRHAQLPHHRAGDRAAVGQGRHLPGDGQRASGAAGVLFRLRPLAPIVVDAQPAHVAFDRRGSAHRAAPGAAAPPDRVDRGRSRPCAVPGRILRQGGAVTLRGHDAAFPPAELVVERVITRAEFEGWISADLARLSATVDRVLAAAGVTADQVDRVFLTGGTAFVPAVRNLFAARFGADKLAGGGEFVSVAEGLALLGGATQTSQ